MVRIPPSKVEEEVQQQNEDFYGGDDLEPKNPKDALEDFIGNDPDGDTSETKPLGIAAEVDHDKEDIRHNPLPDDEPNLEDEEPDESSEE